jgi:hypothetical protein
VRFRDVIPAFGIAAGDTLALDVTLPVPADSRPFAPTALFTTRGTQVGVQNSLQRGTTASASGVTLTSAVAGPPGTRTILDGYYYGLDAPQGLADTTARDFACADPCAHVYPQDFDCSVYCYACSTTVDDSGPYIRENFNLCSLTTPDGGGDPIAVTSAFDLIATGQGGVHLNGLLHRDLAISPHRLELVPVAAGATPLSLQAPGFKRRYPEFVLPAGDYRYRVTPTTRAGVPAMLELPISVRDGQVTGMFITLPRSDRVLAGRAHIIADDQLGVYDRTVTATGTPDSIRVSASLSGRARGTSWVMVSLKPRAVVTHVALVSTLRPRALREGTDYLVTTYLQQPAVMVRITDRQARLTIAGSGLL